MKIHSIPPTRPNQHQKRSHPTNQGSILLFSSESKLEVMISNLLAALILETVWVDVKPLLTAHFMGNSVVIQVSQKGEGQCKYSLRVISSFTGVCGSDGRL